MSKTIMDLDPEVPLVEADRITKRYGTTVALAEALIRVSPGRTRQL